MFRRLLSVSTVLCFLAPILVCAEFAPQFKESSKGKADLSKSAPTHGQVFKSNTAMEKTVRTQSIPANNKVMKRNMANERQGHKIVTGTVNE